MTVANPSDYETGLDEFGVEDAVIPRLSIVHKDAEYKDSLSNEQFGKMKVIILGLVKQRVLWHESVDDGDLPMCRSTNHSLGFPNVSDDVPRDKRFPWGKSGFEKADWVEDDELTAPLNCGGCQLKEWKSHPDGKRPYCSEQFTLPILYDPRDDGNWVPAIITFQKTALKPLKAYLSSFARSKSAAFQAITEIGLDPMRRGSTEYAVPNFRRIGDTDPDEWRGYSMNYRSMADYLRAEPGSREEREDGTPVPSDNTAKPPANKAGKVKEEDVQDAEVVEETPEPKVEPKESPEPKKAPEASTDDDDDDDLPF